MSANDRRGRLPKALVALGLRFPRAVVSCWVVVGSLSAVGAVALRVETSTDSVLDRSSEEWSFYQGSQDRFGGDEVMVLLFKASEPYGEEALNAVADVTRLLQHTDGVRRVDSLATIPLISATGSGAVSLEPAVPLSRSLTASDLKRITRELGDDLLARRALISPDAQSFAVNVFLEAGAEKYYSGLIPRIEEVADAHRGVVSGVPIFRARTDARTRSELALFVPVTLVVLSLLLIALFGSMRAAVLPLLTTGIGVLVVLGVMGVVGAPLTISTVILPSVLLALGAAYSMHLLTAAAGKEDGELAESLAAVALPIALSGLTTAVGFVAVSFVRIEAIAQLGAFGALGVLSVLAAILSAGPALLVLWPLPQRRAGLRTVLSERMAPRLVSTVSRRRVGVVVAWVGVSAVLALGLLRLNVETDVIEWFPRRDPVRLAYEEIRSELAGISPMNVVIEAPEGQAVTSSEALAAMRGLSDHLEANASVGRVASLADPVQQLHRVLQAPDAGALPTDDALIEQYLLILESKAYIHDLLTRDRRYANVLIRVDDNGSAALLGVADQAESWWARNGPEGYSARVTGIMYEFARSEHEIALGQLRGLAFAVLAIGVVLLATFRSLGVAAASLVPNALPIAAAYGAMGLVGIPLDAGTVALGNLALGIAVDDTVHVSEGFQRRVGEGVAPRLAMLGTMKQVLPALSFTTLAVGAAFGVLAMSDFVLVRNLGFLTAGVMGVCLLADLTLLPALLLRGDRDTPV